MENISSFFIIAIGIITTAILGVLFDWIIKLFLPEKPNARHLYTIVIILILLVCVASLSIAFKPSAQVHTEINNLPTFTYTITILPEMITPTITMPPVLPTSSETPFPSPTPTALNISTPSVFPNEITDNQGVYMRLIPAENFLMGSDTGGANEKPLREMYIDSFYMDVYEVTNKLYQTCVEAGSCVPPALKGSFLRDGMYYSNPTFDNFPVIYVNWEMAKSYCEWRGARLPTEAEWEKAARGREGNTYPWGYSYINCNGNISCAFETTQIGTYPKDISKYGIYDMAGNVQEWVADWYSETYYQDSPLSNPPGPSSGESRVLRGSAWNLDDYSARTSFRLAENPIVTYHYVGFRCARSNP